ncbi:hypothetical protein WICANDRAFT_89377, partial [Wickerhamomyces anomalus NRRL Y-366-8]
MSMMLGTLMDSYNSKAHNSTFQGHHVNMIFLTQNILLEILNKSNIVLSSH